MKLNEDAWAIVRPDGMVAGDGKRFCIYPSENHARDNLEYSHRYLTKINGEGLRVARVRIVTLGVRIVEVEETK